MFEVVKNAKVDVKMKYDPKSEGFVVHVEVEGKYDTYEHTFSHKSNVAKMAREVEYPILKEKLENGTYVFSDGNLIDFRMSDYRGYIRTEDEINGLADKVGFSRQRQNNRAVNGDLLSVFNQLRHRNGVFLGGESEDFFMDVEGLGSGGAFRNRLIYRWSPFDKNIQTTIEVERLVCANGMVGMAPLVTRETPVINDIDRNLDIIDMHLRPEMSRILQERFANMSHNRASVSDVLEANRIIYERLRSNQANEHDFKILQGLANVTKLDHLKGVFSDKLFSSSAARTAPSDLTQYDLFNIMTEMCSHTMADEYGNRQAQHFINKIVFDTVKNEVSGNVKKSQESDHRRAFFGE